VVFTCLAELHRHRKVGSGDGGVIATLGASLPASASPVFTAVLAALDRPRRAADLLADPAVVAATDAIGVRLVRRGWVLSEQQQARMRSYGLAGWAVAGWCAVHAGLLMQRFGQPGRAMETLVVLGVGLVLAVVTYLLVDVPPTTRAGRAVLRRARAELRDRRDDDAVIAARVAAYGEPELWRLDPEFAELAGAFSGELDEFPDQLPRW
jgi:uncharacterized protein (TIGR04222 family)